MSGTEVQLIIKAPNQNVDDHIVDCNLEWTVRELKEHLSMFYPDNPAVNEQKLIYSGHLLHDHLHLREILRHEDSQDSVHILHLVYNSQNLQEQHYQSSQNWSSTSIQSSSSPPETTLIHRNVGPSTTSDTVYPAPPVERVAAVQVPPVVFPDPQMAAQIAAMQQMYAYYFTQYLQSLSPPPAAPQVPPPVAEAPPEPRVEDNRGDWLDHLFVFLRFVVLFCVLYFYSTPERLMIVIVCAVIALLYHEGWFMRRLNPPVEAQPVHRNDNDRNQDADDSHDEHDLEAAMDGDLPPHAHPTAPHIFSPLAFLSAFFSSLIPEPPPPPVNIN